MARLYRAEKNWSNYPFNLSFRLFFLISRLFINCLNKRKVFGVFYKCAESILSVVLRISILLPQRILQEILAFDIINPFGHGSYEDILYRRLTCPNFQYFTICKRFPQMITFYGCVFKY